MAAAGSVIASSAASNVLNLVFKLYLPAIFREDKIAILKLDEILGRAGIRRQRLFDKEFPDVAEEADIHGR